jgi:phage-related protein
MIEPDVREFILEVRFYRNDSGVEPVRDWLKSLPKEYRKAIGEDIKTVQYGWPIGMPVVRKLEKSIWEVRSSLKDGIARVLFTTDSGAMILLHGFCKKSQKTPPEVLGVARRRLSNLKKG